jgi:transposase
VERGFRFLKDKSFRVAEIFLKKNSRIQALAMIMVLCLFIYSMVEFRLRRELERFGQTVISQTDKPTQKPTLKWVFFLFSGHSAGVNSKIIFFIMWPEQCKDFPQIVG